MASFSIRNLVRDDPADAAKLADLWNAADRLWPEGLTGGEPMTAERMLEHLARQERLFCLVAEADGGFAGYLGVNAVPGRPDVAQGVTVTVRPEWLGRGCGKALLLTSIARLREMGYRQYRRWTYPGNHRALPLYKKIGDFWEPGSSVRLQNFIPLVLAMPIAQKFFTRHDWYSSFERSLTMAPDDVRWQGVRVYPYRFEAGPERFTLVIDRQSEAPTAVETNEVEVSCRLGREQVLCGVPFTVTWEVTAKEKPVTVKLIAEGPPGLGLRVEENRVVTESWRLESKAVAPPDLDPPPPGAPQHSIRTFLEIDGVPLELATGFRVGQPVEVDVRGLQPAAGKADEEVVVRLFNRLNAPLAGEVSFEPSPGIAFRRLAEPFELAAGGWGSGRFRVTARDGAHPAVVRVRCGALETRPRKVVFRAPPLDHVYAWEDEELGMAVIEAPGFSVQVDPKGGGFSMTERLLGRPVLSQGALSLGPPFSRSPDGTPSPYRITREEGRVRVSLELPWEPVPGVTVERTLTVGAGPFLRVDHRVHNATGVSHALTLRCPGVAGLHRVVTAPLAESHGGRVREVIEGLGDFLRSEGADLPRDPTAWEEGWLAWEEEGAVAGIVWTGCAEAGGSPRLDVPAVPPGGCVDLDPLYFVVARGDWRVVRDLWRRVGQPGGVREEHEPVASPVLDAGFEPPPLLVAGERTASVLHLSSRRARPFSGDWSFRAEGLAVRPEQGPVTDLAAGAPERLALVVEGGDLTPRVVPASVTLRSGATRVERATPVVVMGDGRRTVTVAATGDGTFEVDNGRVAFTVAPGHGGSLVSLRQAGRELLASSFPSPRPYQWMTSWHGGVEPFLFQPGDPRQARDVFTGETARRRGERGLVWSGVRVACPVQGSATRWLERSVDYLTLGGGNLVLLALRLANRSGAPQEVPAGFAVFPALSPNDRLGFDTGEPGDGPRERSLAPPSFRFGDAPWVSLGSLALISFPAPGEAGGWVLDEAAAGLHASLPCRLEPGETRESLAWLVVTGDPAEARSYRILRSVERLP